MAVIQISRIQIRRGRENQGSGVPQLASGELGWAIDTQKLYIGNGAVSEGAPAVGNTQILTENDNLFEYASTYTYRNGVAYIQTGESITSPVVRSLQDRLDDTVSVRAFGCAGDGTDQTVQLQRAIFELFLNNANKISPNSRVTLYVEPGTYEISSTIYLPPHTTIVGAGKNKTIFIGAATLTGPMFKTINDLSTPDNVNTDSLTTTDNQARFINMSGFSIDIATSNTIAFRLQSCIKSTFKDLRIIGTWRSGTDFNNDDAALHMDIAASVPCSFNRFENIEFDGFAYAVYSKYDIKNNLWTNCSFRNHVYGFQFGFNTNIGLPGMLSGPSNNIVELSTFDDIDHEAIWVKHGLNNLSSSNKFYNVGNEGGSSINPLHAVIKFEKNSNSSVNDWFQRSEELGYNPEYLLNVPFVPEVEGPNIIQQSTTQYVRITELGTDTKLIKFPADTTKGIEVDYIYKSNQISAVRKGTIHITVNPFTDESSLADDYEFVGDVEFAENLVFKALNFDEDGDATIDTVALMVLNSTSSDDADFYFRVKTKS